MEDVAKRFHLISLLQFESEIEDKIIMDIHTNVFYYLKEIRLHHNSREERYKYLEIFRDCFSSNDYVRKYVVDLCARLLSILELFTFKLSFQSGEVISEPDISSTLTRDIPDMVVKEIEYPIRKDPLHYKFHYDSKAPFIINDEAIYSFNVSDFEYRKFSIDISRFVAKKLFPLIPEKSNIVLD